VMPVWRNIDGQWVEVHSIILGNIDSVAGYRIKKAPASKRLGRRFRSKLIGTDGFRCCQGSGGEEILQCDPWLGL
jgi:hypothetical protein